MYLKFIIIFTTLAFTNIASAYWNSSKDFLFNHVQWIGIKTSTPNIQSTYSPPSDKEVNFETNVLGAFSYTIGTKYINVSLTSPMNGDRQIKHTKYNDLYIKSNLGNFELTFHSGKFKGGFSKDDIFYNDYKIEKVNLKSTYFFNTTFNKVQNNPLQAIKYRSSTNKSFYNSLFFTIGHDHSITSFPSLRKDDIKKLFSMNMQERNYINQIDSQTLYYGLGYGVVHMLTQNFTYNFKFSFAKGDQKANYLIESKEYALNGFSNYSSFEIGWNYLINKTHNIGFSSDIYSLSTEIKKTIIDTNTSHFFLFYQYFI